MTPSSPVRGMSSNSAGSCARVPRGRVRSRLRGRALMVELRCGAGRVRRLPGALRDQDAGSVRLDPETLG